MNLLKERIAIIKREQRVKQQELADVAGVTKGTVSQWARGEIKAMGYGPAGRIRDKWGYRVDWLLYGKLPKADVGDSPTSGPDVTGLVPVISWIKAGKYSESPDNYRVGEAEEWLPMPKRGGKNTYCLRVNGDSMTAPYGKSYPAGSIIFVDPDQRSPASGQRVIAKLKGSDEVTFKVFVREGGKPFLKPLNSHYPPLHQPFRVLGTVIGKWEDE